MDEMHIKSGMLKGFIGTILSKVIKKKIGVTPTIKIGSIDISNGDELKIHLEIDGSLTKEDLDKLLGLSVKALEK